MEQILEKLTAIEQRMTNLENGKTTRAIPELMNLPVSYAGAVTGEGPRGVEGFQGSLTFHRGGGRTYQQGTSRSSYQGNNRAVRPYPGHQNPNPYPYRHNNQYNNHQGNRWQQGTRHHGAGRGNETNRPGPLNHDPSDNKDFTALAKRLFQFVQLRRCCRIWTGLPKGVDYLIGEAYNNIAPPMPDESFRAKLDSLRDTAKTDILLTVQQHLTKKEAEVQEALTQLDTHDKQRAAAVARSYAIKHFSQKISNEDLQYWITEGLQLLGSNPRQPADNAQAQENQPTTMSSNQESQAGWLIPTRTTKRGLDTILSPSITSNRFQGLEEEDMDNSSAMQDQPNSEHQPTKKLDQRATPIRVAQTTEPINVTNNQQDDDVTSLKTTYPNPNLNPIPSGQRQIAASTSSAPNCTNNSTSSEPKTQLGLKPIVHDDKYKTNMRLGISIKESVKTVIIADSNFRTATELPSMWEVHVYPGIKLGQAARMIECSPNLHDNENLENILISIGMNNREAVWQQVKADFDKVTSAISKTGKKCHFLGISIPPGIKPAEKVILRQLNELAKNKMGKLYIEELNDKEVSVSQSDIHKVHYDQATLQKILKHVIRHFLFLLTGGDSRWRRESM